MTAIQRILVIDDDPISLSLVTMLLDSDGYDTQAASGWPDTVPPGWAPDLILADLNMPGIHGTELATLARERWPAVRIFAMSAAPPVSLSGYDRILRKPLPLEGLRTLLESPQRPQAEEAENFAAIDERVFAKLQASMSPNGYIELRDAFLADGQQRIRALETAIRDSNCPVIKREAHTLRGSAGMIGAMRVHSICAAIETQVDSSDKLEEQFLDLTQAFEELSIILARKSP